MKSLELEPIPTPPSRTGIAPLTAMRGARVPLGPRGTYVSLSHAGFHYLRVDSQSVRKDAAASQAPTPIQREEWVAELNRKRAGDGSARDVLIFVAIFCFGIIPLWKLHALLGLLAFGASVLLVKRWRANRRTASLYYDIDNLAVLERTALASAACEALGQGQGRWLVEYQLSHPHHSPRPAGNRFSGRVDMTASRKAWPTIRTNLELWTLAAEPLQLLFLPDGLLVAGKQTAELFPYEQLAVQANSVDLVETGIIKSDALRVGTTYRHLNKSGGPDRRRRDNPELPIVRYGRATIASHRGLHLVLETSRVDIAEYFVKALCALGSTWSSNQGPGAAAPTAGIVRADALSPAVPGYAHSGTSDARSIAHPTTSNARPAPTMAMQALSPPPSPMVVDTARGLSSATTLGTSAATSIPHPRAIQQSHDNAWVPPGRQVQVGGWVIPNGMIYVGDTIPPVHPYREEPALISSRLPCASPSSASREDFGYWPSYSRLNPGQRSAYLNWLATGRRDPNAVIGCPFLFLYGLERRLLHDLEQDPSIVHEAPALLLEVERLLTIYGPKSNSFLHYARDFVAFCRAAISPSAYYDMAPPLEPHHEVPLAVKLALGQLVAEGKPIPARWGLAWYLTSPKSRLRTPARRCADEFIALFEHRYIQSFGEGLRVKPNKTLLRHEYRPASPAFAGPVQVQVRGGGAPLPDITRLSRPFKQIADVAEACMDALDGYSRALGPEPTPEKRLRALDRLPPELTALVTAQRGPAADFAAWLRGATKGDLALVSGADLIERWLGSPGDKLSANDARAFSSALEKLGYGLEPDPRFGGDPMRATSRAVLFSLPSGASAEPSGGYAFMSLWLRLAALVALSDGRLDPREEELLHGKIENAPDVDAVTRTRLRAYLLWLLTEKPDLRGLGKRVEALTRPGKERVAQLAVAVAGADGCIDPAEVKMLERIYKLLGLDDSKLFEDIHELQATGGQDARSGPVRVRDSVAGPGGYSIPAGQPDASGGFELDMAKIRRKEAESRAVAELLSNIFEEGDEPTASEEAIDVTPSASDTHGMTNAEASLLRALASAPSWPRADFDELAHRHGLMPSAALDSVNELSIERTGDPVLVVEEDAVIVDSEIMQELLIDV